jgi:integrase
LFKLKQPHLKKLERLGREHALFYLMAVSTGLRHKELRSLTLGQLYLDAKPAPYFELYANQSKSGKESWLPLRTDVVEKIKQHLEHRSKQGYKTLLFESPPGIRVFDADSQAAGIAKNDARGRVIDIHALRTTFVTHLAVAGVHPRVAQAAMRHSRIELTTNFYTDPVLLDVNGAVNELTDWAFTWPGRTDTLDAITQPPDGLGFFFGKGRALFVIITSESATSWQITNYGY